MTWLDDKIKKYNHKVGDDVEMGSVGGMVGMAYDDRSTRFPLVFTHCKKCGYYYVSYELMPHQKVDKATIETIELINSFYNIRD